MLILGYIGYFSFLSILRYEAFFTASGDLAVYDQAIWNTLHGRPFVFTSWGGTISHLGIHTDLTVLFLAPLYLFFADPRTLFIVQAVVVALGALPAFWIARDSLKSQLAGLVFALAYLLHPGLQGATLMEYHGVTLAASLLLFAFYFMKGKWHLPFLIFAVLAMSTKENIPLVVMMMGLYQMAIQRELRWGLGTAALGGLSFWLAFQVVMPHFNSDGATAHWYLYARWGDSPASMLVNIIRNPSTLADALVSPARLDYVRDMLAPLGFLSPLGLPAFIISVPSWGINLLSASNTMFTVGIRQYPAELVPILLASAIAATVAIVAAIERLLPGRGSVALYIVLGYVVVSALLGQYRNGYTPLRPEFAIAQVAAHEQAAERIMSMIPGDAVVATTHSLAPHLTRREKLYYVDTVPSWDVIDYVVLDILRYDWDKPIETYQEINRLIQDEDFAVVSARDGVILLQHHTPGAELPEEFFSFARPLLPPSIALSVRFGDEIELVGMDIKPGNILNNGADTVLATGYWRLLKPGSDLLPALYFDTESPSVGGRGHPPGLVWYPTSRWKPGETVKIDYLSPIWVGDLSQEFDLSVGVTRGSNEWATALRLVPDLRQPEEAFSVLPGQNIVKVASVRQQGTLPGIPLVKSAPRLRSTPESAQPAAVHFQEELSLLGYELETESVLAGGRLALNLYWQADREMSQPYTMFIHLYDPSGQLRTQSDGEPAHGRYPTTGWRTGEVVADRREVSLDGLPPGDYSLEVGVYHRSTGQRLQATSAGQALPDGRARVSKIVVQPPAGQKR